MSLEQPIELPAGHLLPDTDGEPMDSEWVVEQTRDYLVNPLKAYLAQEKVVAFVGGNSFVYYVDPRTSKLRNLGPDFYVVRGGVQAGQTKWVSHEEGGLLPTTVIEFLSESTETRDRGEKFCIYRDVFKTDDYFLVDPETLFIEGFTWQRGHYVPLTADREDWYFVRSLDLYLGVEKGWVRFRTPQGELLATDRERADGEKRRADKAQRRADEAQRRADEEQGRANEVRERNLRLEEKLRSLGLDPDQI
ncbi:MAG: Uma2 family endonuclease [Vulcanimicrobiota bacterium]